MSKTKKKFKLAVLDRQAMMSIFSCHRQTCKVEWPGKFVSVDNRREFNIKLICFFLEGHSQGE